MNEHDINLSLNDNKNNGLITKIWGEHLWESVHCIAFGYPVKPTSEQKEQYRTFFTFLQYVLPCKYCRDSYGDFLADTNAKPELNCVLRNEDLENRETLTKWAYRLHNRVNAKLGIDYKLTYEDVVKKYESYRAKCMPNEKGCNMPLNLKADSYKISKMHHAQVITIDRYNGFKTYALKRGVKFDDRILGILNLDRYDEIWVKRDKKCRQIMDKMRLNGIPQVEKSGEYYNLPTIEELKLIELLCSDICCEELDIMIENIKKMKL